MEPVATIAHHLAVMEHMVKTIVELAKLVDDHARAAEEPLSTPAQWLAAM